LSNSLTITVSLPNDFISQLDKEIDGELQIAQKKWKLNLSEDEQNLVRKSARDQLRSKVSTLSKNTWDLGSKLVITAAGATGTLAVKPGTKVNSEHSLLLNKNGWSVTTEEADAVVPSEDFYEDLINRIFTWVRTAVFYGVGSYSSR